MRKVLLSLAVLLTTNISAFAQSDNCNTATFLCGDNSTSAQVSSGFSYDPATEPDCDPRFREVGWYMVEGISGDSAIVSLSSLNDSVYMSIYDDCGGAQLRGCKLGTPSSTLRDTFDVIPGDTFYIALAGKNSQNTSMLISVRNVSGIDGDSVVVRATDPSLIVPSHLCIGDTFEVINNSTEYGDSTTYELISPAPISPWIGVGEADTFVFDAPDVYDFLVRSVGENCQNKIVGTEHMAIKLTTTLDTVDVLCVNTPIGLTAMAIMQPGDVSTLPDTDPLKNPNVTSWVYKIAQSDGCQGDIAWDMLSKPANCYDTTWNQDTLYVTDTCVTKDNEPAMSGIDTLWYVPCNDTLWVELVADGTCNKDSMQQTYILNPPIETEWLAPVVNDTVQYCLDDTTMEICLEIDQTALNPGMPPFKYTWYDSTIAASREIGFDSTMDISDCIYKDTLQKLRDLSIFHPDDYRSGPLRYIVRIEDSLGCVAFDTVYLVLCKPVIDSLHITSTDSATLTCDPDENAMVLCTEYDPLLGFCPGDSIPISTTARGKPGLKFEWFESDQPTKDNASLTPLTSGLFTSWGDTVPPPRDSVHFPEVPDSLIWFKERARTTDFYLALVVTDSMGCKDTSVTCIPIHEPPTPDMDRACVGTPPDSLMLCIRGACPGSDFVWDTATIGGVFYDALALAPHDTLLVDSVSPTSEITGGDSCKFFDYRKLGWTPQQLKDSTFQFAVIVHDIQTGCIDTVFHTFQFDTAIVANLVPTDTTVCEEEPVTVLVEGDTADVTFEWYENDTLATRFGDTSQITVTPANDSTEIKVIMTRGQCMSADSMYILIDPLPVIDSLIALPNDTICRCDTVTIEAYLSPADTNDIFAWSSVQGSPILTQFDTTRFSRITAEVCISDTFNITVTDTASGCVKDSSINIFIQPTPEPVFNVNPDTICFNMSDTVILDGSASVGSDLNYLWTAQPPAITIDDSTAQVTFAVINQVTEFSLTVTDTVFGCDSTMTDTVYIFPRPTISPDNSFCSTDADKTDTIRIFGIEGGTVDTSLTAGRWDTLLTEINDSVWVADFNTTSFPDTITFTFGTVHGTTGCEDTLTHQVILLDSVALTVTPVADTICENESAVFRASGGAVHIWTSATDPAFSGGPVFADSITVSPPTVGNDTTTHTYRVVGLAGGCSDTAFVSLFVRPLPTVDAGQDDSICQGNSYTLSNASASTGTVAWTELSSSGGTFTPDTSTLNPVFTPPSGFSGTLILELTATDAEGCENSDTIQIEVNPNPSANAGPDELICFGDSVTIGGSPTAFGGSGGPFTYAWIPNTAIDDSTIANPEVFPTTTTTYTVVIFDVFGCSDTDMVDVTVNPQFEVAVTNGRDTICINDTTQLSVDTLAGSPGTPGYNYSWTPAANLNNANIQSPVVNNQPLGSQMYVATVTDANNCTAVDSAAVFVRDSARITAFSILPDDSICQGDQVDFNISYTSVDSIRWTDNGNNGSFTDPTADNPTYTPHADTTGTVNITVTLFNSACGSKDTTVAIEIFPAPVVFAGPDDTICQEDSYTLSNATEDNTSSVTWTEISTSGGTFTPDTNTLNATFTPPAAFFGTVMLELTGGGIAACPENRDTIIIEVLPDPVADAGFSTLTVCQEDPTVTLGGSPVGADTVLWSDLGEGGTFTPSNDIINPVYIPDQADSGLIQLVMRVSNTCGVDFDTIELTITDRPDINTSPTYDTVCQGLPVEILAQFADNPDDIFWIKSTDLTDTIRTSPDTVLIDTPSTSTVYYAYITKDGCTGVDSSSVFVKPNPVPVPVAQYLVGGCYPLDVIFDIDEGAMNIPPGLSIVRVTWDFDDGTVTDQDPVSAPVEHTYIGNPDSTYPVVYNISLAVTYDNNCLNDSIINIEVCEEFFAPNVFTPNNDGNNDFLIFRGIDNQECQLMVFNRWGEKVFETSAYQNDWEGTDMKGDELNSDVFYYVLNCDGGTAVTGWVKIIRD